MSKLFKKKAWVTLEDAADHISGVLAEKVAVPDLLQLALEGQLTLSVNIVNGVSARTGRRISIDDAPIRVMPSLAAWRKGSNLPAISDYPGDDDPAAQLAWCIRHQERFDSGELVMFRAGTAHTSFHTHYFDNAITTIWGVWDIPLLGGERLDLQHALQHMIDGPDVTAVSLDGAFLVRPGGEIYAQLMEHVSANEFVKDRSDSEKYPHGDPRSYYPAGGLPRDEKVVVRTQAISDFLFSLAEEPIEVAADGATKEVGTRERNNLFRVIAGLAVEAKIDLRSEKATVQIAEAGRRFGGPSEKTIRGWLSQIRETVLDGRVS